MHSLHAHAETMVIDEVNGEGAKWGHTDCWEIKRQRERERGIVGMRQKDKLDGDKGRDNERYR